MIEKEMGDGIQEILNMKIMQQKKVELLIGFVTRYQAQAYAVGKAQAYKEMFSVMCELAGKDKIDMAKEKMKDLEIR